MLEKCPSYTMYPLSGIIFFAALVVEVVQADDGDDVSNNLFSDLAPLLSLFGEQFAKQFLSESMGWLDHIIFAMAPLGILTAIVAAIRISGPSWLRALVGRARENRAAAEVELMSSTSHEVCELWNGQAVVRTLGRPQVQQIIYLKAVDDKESKQKDLEERERTFGLFTVEDATKKEYLKSEPYHDPLSSLLGRINNFFRPTSKGKPIDEESSTRQDLPPGPAMPTPAPNISLNLHGGTEINELYCVALIGIVLQFGVLVFTGLTVYHPEFSKRFSKNGSRVQTYSYPLMATGTLILAFGMIICAAVIEQSTEETKIVAGKALGTAKPELNARILWLQKSHIVSDQMFDSFVNFGQHPRQQLMTSRRSAQSVENPAQKFRSTGSSDTSRVKDFLVSRARKIASCYSEGFTLFGTFTGLVGFVLQFEGLRGMNWSASIAQLVAVFMMTALRAWIRRGLIVTPIPKKTLEQHEMDWLALRIASAPNDNSQYCRFWPTRKEDFDGVSSIKGSTKASLRSDSTNDERISWRVSTGPKNLACKGSTQRDGGQDICRAQRAVLVRRRLGQLAAWTSKVSRVAVAVAEAIGAVMNTLGPAGDIFYWALKVEVGPKEEKIHLKFQKLKDKWKIDATEIEAILSLWLFDIRENESRIKEIGVKGKMEPSERTNIDWLQQDAELVRHSLRILGPVREDLRRDISWWVDGRVFGDDGFEEQVDFGDKEVLQVGYIGIESQSSNSDRVLQTSMASQAFKVVSESSTESLLGQHIFSAFMWAVAPHVPTENIEGRGKTAIRPTDTFRIDNIQTLSSLKLENTVLRQMLDVIGRSNLATSREALEYIIPPLSCAAKLPMLDVIDFVWQQARDYEARGQWEAVIPLYIEIFRICRAFGANNHASRRATIILAEAYCTVRALVEDHQNQRRSDPIEALNKYKRIILEELHTQDKFLLLHIAQIYLMQPDRQHLLDEFLPEDNQGIELEIRMARLSFGISSSLTESHSYFSHPSLISKIHNLKPPIDLDDIRKEITDSYNQEKDQVDILGRIPLHYAALEKHWHLVRGLIDFGIDPNTTDIAGWTPLHYASQKDDDVVVSRLIGGGAYTNIQGRDGMTPLHCAAKAGHQNIVNILIQAGADTEISDNTGKTALNWAAFKGEKKVVELLVKSKPNAVRRDEYGRTVLHFAALGEIIDEMILPQLLQVGIDINAKDREGQCALHIAAATGNVSSMPSSGEALAVKLLLDNGADIEATAADGRTPLHYAVANSNKTTVQLLLDRDANIEAIGEDGLTPLHLVATKGGDEVIIQLLLDRGADIEAAEPDGWTPLHFAVNDNNKAAVQLFLDRGSNIKFGDWNRRTALHRACHKGDEAMIQLLLDRGANIEAKDTDGWKALHYAAKYGNEAMIKLLLDRGADMEPKNRSGRTPLHYAAEYGNEAMIKLLLDRGADIDFQNGMGETPLHCAVAKNSKATVQLLLDRNANIKATNEAEETPLHYAIANNNKAAAQLLLDHGANIKTTNSFRDTLLHCAATKGDETMIQLLLDRGANIEAENFTGQTALHSAASKGNKAMVKVLLDRGANIESKDGEEWTPLHAAAHSGQEAASQLLLDRGANIKATETYGWTPLKLAEVHKQDVIVRLLKMRGA